MAANADVAARGGGITDDVADGKKDAAIAIDFLIRNAISDGKPVSLVYPKGTAFLPAYVAVVASAPHAREARNFASYVVSNPGQKLLFAPGAARYPIRPDVYTNAPQGTANPFTLPEGSTFAYDFSIGPARSPLISALFDAPLTSRADRLKTLWGAIHTAEAKASTPAARAKVQEARSRPRIACQYLEAHWSRTQLRKPGWRRCDFGARFATPISLEQMPVERP